jgi:hypothetical protein
VRICTHGWFNHLKEHDKWIHRCASCDAKHFCCFEIFIFL